MEGINTGSGITDSRCQTLTNSHDPVQPLLVVDEAILDKFTEEHGSALDLCSSARGADQFPLRPHDDVLQDAGGTRDKRPGSVSPTTKEICHHKGTMITRTVTGSRPYK